VTASDQIIHKQIVWTTSIPCIGFVAPSGTGKTTLLSQLAPHLIAQGFRLGYLKHAHHGFDIDQPGKDSHRMRVAGAKQVLIASQQRWAFLCESPPEEPALAHFISQFDAKSTDLILAEGFRGHHYPKLEIHRQERSATFLYPDDPDIIAVVSDQALPLDASLPQLPLDQPQVIATFIMQLFTTTGP
jgi:molybdopterin-guanine dinucleotide biosynthesis protein B